MEVVVSYSENHYLFGESSDEYKKSLEECLEIISKYATKKQVNKLISDLQIQSSEFNEAQYLQAACETSVAASIAREFPEHFQYEPKLNPPNDIDCSFEIEGFKFNIEIKCPDYTKLHEQRGRDIFSIGAFGRMPEYTSTADDLKELFSKGDKSLEVQPHMDNKLKDYLLSAHKKFSTITTSSELNVLFVCCDDAMDMQKWFFYMFGMQGLLTPKSYWSVKQYSNVDAVILSNLYHRHHNYFSKKDIDAHWCLANSFNLIFKNRSVNKGKDAAICKLVDLIPNFSREIMEYECSEINQYFRIPAFVNEVLDGKSFSRAS